MSDPDLTEAEDAALDAWYADGDLFAQRVRDAVAAAAPLIEAQVRARIAADIEAIPAADNADHAIYLAARIARGGPS